jgi:hypothetical protein
VRLDALERRVPAVFLSFAAAVETEIARRGDENVIDEDGRISFDAESLGELRLTIVLDDETRFAVELLDDALSQQTCRIGDVSRVRPSHERYGDGRLHARC